MQCVGIKAFDTSLTLARPCPPSSVRCSSNSGMYYDLLSDWSVQGSSRLCDDGCESGELPRSDEQTMGLHHEDISIVSFDEWCGHEKQLAYMLECDHSCKRITICFRGFVTKDPLKVHAREMSNPLRNYDWQASTVSIRQDIYSILFEPSSPAIGSSKKRSAYQFILQERLIPMMKRWIGYKLYVTGQNSGAAIATLFGFRAATEPACKVPKPVTIISIASPRVGGHSFQLAHQLLEGMGKLRHLRIAFRKDIVAVHPLFSLPRNPFVDTGLRLLFDEGHRSFEISYPTEEVSWLDDPSRDWLQDCPVNFCWNPTKSRSSRAASLREYCFRLTANKEKLSGLRLNDLYCSKKLVGDLVINAKAALPARRTEKQTHFIFLSTQ